MKISSRWFVVTLLTMVLAVVSCSDDGSGGGTTTSTESATTTTSVAGATTTSVPAALADGTWFAYVTVGEDETGAMTLGIDPAEMLTGEEARQAAIDAGVIGEDEDLPNDYFIRNDEERLELLHVAEDARFRMISGSNTSEFIEVNAPILAEIYAGTYGGDPIYGVPAGVPIVMNVTVADGVVTGAEAVYLP